MRSPEEGLHLVQLALVEKPQEASSMIAMAAGAALYDSEVASSLEAGILLANECVKDGGGIEKLNQLVEYSSKF